MSFWEFVIIGVVGLIVIGPDKLPQTIKTVLKWFTRVKRVLNDTRSEFEKQLGVDEIRREIHNEEVMESLNSLKIVKDEITQETEHIEQHVGEAQEVIRDDFEDEDEGIFGEQHHNHPPEEAHDEDNLNVPKDSS